MIVAVCLEDMAAAEGGRERRRLGEGGRVVVVCLKMWSFLEITTLVLHSS